MCILIASPYGSVLTHSELLSCFQSNPDGIGVSVWNGHEIETFKAMDLADFTETYLEIAEGNPHILHFRWATHGVVGLENCHPFVDKRNRIAMAHNGILPWRSTSTESDTRCFFNDVVKHNHDKITDADFQDSIEQILGRSNKMAFLDNSGDVTIYNEHLGHWCERRLIWFSNDSYRDTWADDCKEDEYRSSAWSRWEAENKLDDGITF